MEKYESKAKTTVIKATSRISTKIKDDFYTIEYTEERTIPDIDEADIKEERALLWDTVNSECDGQINDIYAMIREQEQSIKNKMHKY